jgi:transposase
MHKSLDHMHLHVPHVLSEVTGVTGLRLLRAIVAGERDPRPFATDRASRIQSSEDTMAKALEGDARPAPGFTLTSSLALYDFTHQHIAACAQEIERGLRPFASLVEPDEHPLPPPNAEGESTLASTECRGCSAQRS